MTTVKRPACEVRGCQRYLGAIDGFNFICDAFPRGIPAEILSGANDHTGPVEGDDGLLYLAPTEAQAVSI